MVTFEKPKAKPKKRRSQKKKGGAGLLILAALGGLALAFTRKDGNGGPGSPQVNVGADQTVQQDAQGQGSAVVNYTVSAENPVDLVWSGSPGVVVTPGVAGQAIVTLPSAGAFTVRLTATDTVSLLVGFDELTITVTAAPEPVLQAGRLVINGDRISEFHAARLEGEPLSLSWPCQNIGGASGSAFLAVSEGGAGVFNNGPTLPIGAGQTVSLTLNQAVNLLLGTHNLLVEMVEDTPAFPVIASQPIVVDVVGPADLAVVGLPFVQGVAGLNAVTTPPGGSMSIEWPVQNLGGEPGLCRMKVAITGPFGVLPSKIGAFVSVAPDTTVSLVLGLTQPAPGVNIVFTCVVTVETEFLETLGTFTVFWTIAF